MNDDALAAVIATADLLLMRAADAPAALPSRWALAARMRAGDAGRARTLAGARSRWTIRERLRD